MRKKRDGKCYVCGNYGRLTDEHIPPEAAFNGRKVVMTQMLFDRSDASRIPPKRRREFQSGYKRPVLCEKCNTTTGGWYGTEYARFAQYCAEVAQPGFAGRKVGVDLTAIRPLRVFKQALVMVCASSTDGVAHANPAVRKLMLDKHATGRPGDLRLFCYLVAGVAGRSTGVIGVGGLGRSFHVVAEFAWWPVGWVLAFGQEDLSQLYDVTHWSTSYGYDDRSAISILLPCLPIGTPMPLDFRTTQQVARDQRRNLDNMKLIKPR